MSPFSKEIKNEVNELQNYICARCGDKFDWLSAHHKIPEHALRPLGIRGKNILDNAVGLCNGEHGKGEGSEDDCHEVVDRMAIDNKLFWKEGRFVNLSEVDPNTYVLNNYDTPKVRGRRNKRHHRKH
jgi:hypothetical protein